MSRREVVVLALSGLVVSCAAWWVHEWYLRLVM